MEVLGGGRLWMTKRSSCAAGISDTIPCVDTKKTEQVRCKQWNLQNCYHLEFKQRNKTLENYFLVHKQSAELFNWVLCVKY